MARKQMVSVAVVMTVKNDTVGCATTLTSLTTQTWMPDEVIVVDGGSTDGTRPLIRQYASSLPQLRLIDADGANIARGRNIGTAHATSRVIATIDSGCRAEPDWLAKLLQPFLDDAETEFVAGFYRIDARSLLEHVVGLATMRGQLEPVCPETFNPSARSMAFTKQLWERAGGWPEWVSFSEDTLFDHKVRRLKATWRFAGDAIVHWRPRTSLRSIAMQFYHYGTGRGHTQIDAESFAYGLRNLLIVAIVGAWYAMTPWAAPAFWLLFGYFYLWAFHEKASHVARRTARRAAYPLCLLVLWITTMSHLAGYLVGSWQRRCDRTRFQHRMDAYLAGP